MNEYVYNEIKSLSEQYKRELDKRVNLRIEEMRKDDKSHYLLYGVLGIDNVEGDQIDIYQNKGRFLYQYAGSFLEKAVMICFKHKFHNAEKARVENPFEGTPKNFEIDCLVGTDAHELKWRDATTDGDHINKGRRRIEAIKYWGYTPIRLMFYEPQRKQARDIQQKLKALYMEVGGKYYSGEEAWQYVTNYTGVDLNEILEAISRES
ncbi:ApaLI-like restriction endonuclease [Ruminobacter amylophilus]|uniref:ApaLI-like restriction endonuclease n=1 Tax=Ruminobacter amylophilus TaxID=867 RepID=A0A662ZL27_9GAMM|nr:ApaLI family restriction endonuclease [Ruminobacter amylophilus]SFP70912.1 ApaLI-like restriction endonuclease [Ruminobacter amylophilus]